MIGLRLIRFMLNHYNQSADDPSTPPARARDRRRGGGTMNVLRSLGAVAVLAFLLLQFIRPRIDNPPVVADLQAPPEVKQILRNSCYNCHSNETKLAWFDQIVPAYWIVANDVKQARMHVNFSELGARPVAEQKATLFEAVHMIHFDAMPLPSYRRVHPDSVVTDSQLAVLRAYLTPAASSSPAPATDIAAANAQYQQWMGSGNIPLQVSAAPNGIAFPSDYKNWKAISSTDRFDNQTVRVVLANDIAVKAVAENHIDPWPDGAMLAKVAWKQPAGAFFQVEFMIKDSRKYASTLGWGFARWRGADLKPYGKDAAFAAECVGCHTPLRKSDYVFTEPVKAPVGDPNPLQWRVITSAVNPQDSTMSTLFGNDSAVEYARTHSQHDYPAGSTLALVTWTEREDPRWFGAKIPGAVKSIELVKVSLDAQHRPVVSYQDVGKNVPAQQGRASYLLSQRAAVMP
jgi:hypothetical protein